MTTVLISGFVSQPDKKGKSSPQYEGIVVIPGLTDSVTVYRDEKGMPHIYATCEHDLYLATGYITAQERLWQMDLVRRSSTGRMAEIFGKSFVQTDILTRCLRIEEISKLMLRDEDPAIVACLQAYAAGVNAFISTPGRKLPFEFRVLSYEPDPWIPEDIVCILGLLGWNLSTKNLADDVDIYAEKINPDNPGQYLFNGAWKDMTEKSEIIAIKGGKKDTVVIRSTHRGPLLSGLIQPVDPSKKVDWTAIILILSVRTISCHTGFTG